MIIDTTVLCWEVALVLEFINRITIRFSLQIKSTRGFEFITRELKVTVSNNSRRWSLHL